EARLPLGDALLGPVLGASWLAPTLAALDPGSAAAESASERLSVNPGPTTPASWPPAEAPRVQAALAFPRLSFSFRENRTWEVAHDSWQGGFPLAMLAAAPPVRFAGLGLSPSSTGDHEARGLISVLERQAAEARTRATPPPVAATPGGVAPLASSVAGDAHRSTDEKSQATTNPLPSPVAAGHFQGDDRLDLAGVPGSLAARQCSPAGVERTDYFLDVTSTLPHYYRLPPPLDIHPVSPVYPGERRDSCPVQAVILLHGRTTDAVSTFDLQFRDYSLQERMALAGFETFSYSRLGFGLSTHFGLDDPCNASQADQEMFLIPNPLEA